MAITKKIRDGLIRMVFGQYVTPRGLFELSEYFRRNNSIDFVGEKTQEGLVAKSTNFRHGSIVTFGKDEKELDKNIKDAILTSFCIPSSYSKEAKVVNTREQTHSKEAKDVNAKEQTRVYALA